MKMSMQVQIQKLNEKIDFLMSSMYDRYDLTNLIRQGQRFMIRQGDLIVANYEIYNRRQRGLTYARMVGRENIYTFMMTHQIIDLGNETVLIHPEHGIVIIPEKLENLNFYTFRENAD
ncbi:hypothetical protein AFV9_gp23 [Betalipothrixvirus uzonense]|uniref:Uncharacterized protein n=1 Tax=Betalipothrixvirus uzonense TaxID=512792 RepID=B2CRK0_9VIRU|nr:hypothetical protein AFV9_gp23 [Acidianus filamentous virus 9]ACB37257.1 hypothetical protein [Acidianus filamentous virus 9]